MKAIAFTLILLSGCAAPPILDKSVSKETVTVETMVGTENDVGVRTIKTTRQLISVKQRVEEVK